MPKFREGGARVFSDEIPLFEKIGREKRLWVSQLDFLSLEADPYKKIAALRRLTPGKAAIFLSPEPETRGLLLPQILDIMSRIHNSKIFELVQLQKRFSITWVAEDGRKIFVPDAELCNKNEDDSFGPKDGMYSKGRRFNIVCLQSGEVRTVNIDSIIEFNGEEVYI